MIANGTVAASRAARVAALALGALSPVLVDAGLLYEPGNYAARGSLILQLDGIRNVGMLKAHDNTAKTWTDLAAGNVATFANVTGSGVTSEWAADGYVFGGGEYGILAKTVDPANVFTVQIVCDVKPSEQESNYPSLFGAADDKCNFYTYGTGEKIMFKTALGTNIGLDNWAGRYLTAMYYEAGKTSFQTATGTAPSKGDSTSSVYPQTFCIGSVYKASDANYAKQRYLNGTVKAIRIYNRILSASELQQNRALDDARFFNGIPVTNVVVATAVAGLEGTEGSGVYAYDDNGYTFSAPHKATMDGVDYVCMGYTLETWDGSSWSAPVFTAALRYAATDTSAKVRLIWQWQRASGSKPADLDPLFDDYVTDGLILHLDGIRNVGADKPHDYSAREWIDLASGNRATFGNASGAGVTSEWTDDGYVFGGGEIGRLANTIDPGNAFTIQIVCDADKSVQTAAYPHYFGVKGDQCNFYTYKGDNNKLVFRVKAVSNVSDVSINPWTGPQKYITALYDKGKSSVFKTETGSVTAGTTETSVGARAFTIAGIYTGSASDTTRYLNGTIKSVRVYNRVLTAEELAQNRAVDEARFFGAGESEPNVVVASSVRGVSGDTPDGGYVLPAGGHTFTAPASVTVGADSYSCTGYTLETWDDSIGAWGAPVSYSGALAAALTDTTAKVRLTWRWTHTAGPGYDAAFNDYVTDGLVVHLDGIRNTGAQAVHDSAAATWADLANPGDYAKFVIPDADCGWTDNGYYFDGKSVACYAIMNAERTLGNTFTAQAVVDFDRNASHRINTAWPAIFGTTANALDPFAMYYNQNNSGDPGVCFKVANTHVRYGGVKSWGGEYMTGWSDGSTCALFQTVTPDLTTNLSLTVGTRTFTFCGGNGDSQGYTTRRFDGTGKAARLYNRALTDAELAQNRAADEVRFFGRSPATAGDLVVASTVEGLGGDMPCGAYRPAAGHAFTAPTEAILDGIPYELKGYTLETWDGSAWADAVQGNGMNAVAPDVSAASKRLTWHWAVKSRLTKLPDSYDVGDYVQDGLYLFYDGIRNAGATAEHDPNATEWVNLGVGDKGVNLNAVFDYASNASAGDGWETDGYHFKYGGKFARLASNPKIDWKVTIQVVCEAEKSLKSGDTYPTYFGSTNDYLNIYGFGAVARTFFKIRNNSGDGGGRMELSPSGSWEGKYLSAIWHAGKYQVFQSVTPSENGWWGSWRKWWAAFQDQPFYIGGVYNEDDATYVNERRLTGKIQAIRVYNRSLSDEELAHNRMVDDARFKGVKPPHNVSVAGKYAGFDGEGIGDYLVEGRYSFTASAANDAKAGKVRPVLGYTIETWDETAGAWGEPVYHAGSSYTYTAGTDSAKVRITWKWQPDGMVLGIR